MLELRWPSGTPSWTSRRQSESDRRVRVPPDSPKTHRGSAARVISSGERPAGQTLQGRPLGWTDGGATIYDRHRREDRCLGLSRSRLPDFSSSRMREIEVAPSPTRYCLYHHRQLPQFALKSIERSIAAVRGVNIEDDEVRYLPGDNSNIGVRPVLEPIADLVGRWARVLQRLPSQKRAFIAGTQRQNRPSASQIALRCFNLGSPCHHESHQCTNSWYPVKTVSSKSTL